MISMVTFIWVPSAGISSVADDNEGKAQGHDRRGLGPRYSGAAMLTLLAVRHPHPLSVGGSAVRETPAADRSLLRHTVDRSASDVKKYCPSAPS